MKKGQEGPRLSLLAPMKPLSFSQKGYIKERRCFLLRNWEKVKRVREALQKKVNGQLDQQKKEEAKQPQDMLKTGLTALATARSMQTRRLAIAQDDPKVNKIVKLSQLLREIYGQLTTIDGKSLKI